jgi:hypothetical protein
VSTTNRSYAVENGDEIGEYEWYKFECSNKFVRPKLTEIEILFSCFYAIAGMVLTMVQIL